jgi:chromosome partitioning protein
MAIASAQYSEKGGVAKTSNTNGLAAVAGDRGMRVVVVDGDPRGSATEELGVDPGDDTLTFNDLLYIPTDGDPPDPAEVVGDVIQPAGKSWPPTVRVIPAERALARRETDMAPLETRLKRAMTGVNDVDLWLFDLPPRAGGKLVTTMLNAATTVLIPATLTADGFRGVEQARRTMKLIKQGVNPGLAYAGIVRSIVPRAGERRTVHDEVDNALADTYPGEIIDVQITEYAIREEARLACVPITAAPGREAKILTGAYNALLDYLLSEVSRG